MTVYLEHKRKDVADLAGKLQHAISGPPLLLVGIAGIRAGEDLPLSILEVAISVAVLITFLLDLRAVVRRRRNPSHPHGHPRVGWFDIAAGVLLIYEAFHGAHTKPGYLRPQFLTGVVTLALGVLHARLHRMRSQRRYLTVDDSGVDCRVNRFRRFRAKWEEIAAVKMENDRLVFQRKDGKRHMLNLRGLHNAHAVRQALEGRL